MSGEEKAKELASSIEAKNSELSKTLTSSSAFGFGFSRTGFSSSGLVPNPDREENDPHDAVDMKRSLR